MLRSIKWKLIVMYLGLVLIVMIVSGTYILLSLRNIEIDKARQQLQVYAEKIAEQVVMNGDEEQFQEDLMRTVSNAVGMQGNILNAQGDTIASTTVSQPPYQEYKSSVISVAMAGVASFSSGKKSTDSASLFKEWLSYAMPVRGMEEEVQYIVFTRLDASNIQASLEQTTKTIVIAVIMVLFLAAVMGYIFAQTLTGPIMELTKGAKNLAEGNLNQALIVHSTDEIGQLTASFNDMAAELAKNMMEISKEKNKLEIILHNMTDGVLSFDKYGNLIHYNTASLDMLELNDMTMTFQQFINAFDIDPTAYLEAEEDASNTVNFSVGEKYINASFSSYFTKTGEIAGVVIVLQDITEQKKLDDMRKEFVANVSHELRTPLTTIKSYTETLMEGAVEETEIAMEFLGIVNSEADRMAFLVRDLLQLSRFDNQQIALDYSEIHLNEFLSDIVKQTMIHAENKEQNLFFQPWEKDVKIFADKDRVSQVVNNIITNAIKYSPEHAEIKVYLTEDSRYIKISVQDTGMGIQKEDLSRIFERFYRVDKARSRAMGGTGLGLAIAKDIMELHQGKITAQSEYGHGTTMTMWFPKDKATTEA